MKYMPLYAIFKAHTDIQRIERERALRHSDVIKTMEEFRKYDRKFMDSGVIPILELIADLINSKAWFLTAPQK